MKNVLINFFLLFMMTDFIINAQSFTIEDAIKTALENNRDIQIARLEIEKAQKAVNEAFGYALPSLDISGRFGHFISKPKMAFPDFEAMLANATYGILFSENVLPSDESKFLPLRSKLQSFAQTNNYETNLSLTQIIFNSAVFRGIGASQIYLNLSNEQLNAKISEVILNVKKAFYGAMLAKRFLEITESSLDNAERNLSNLKAYYREGLVSDFDLLQAEVMVENIRPSVFELENLYSDAMNKLKIVLALTQDIEIEITGNFTYNDAQLPDVDESVRIACEKNHSISTLSIKRQIDEEFVALDRSEYWPQLTAFGNLTYAGSSDKWDFQNYSSATVGLSLSMNLFKGIRTSNKVEQSLIGVRQTDEQLKILKDFIASEVKKTLNNLNRVKTQIDAVTRNVELAEKAYSIALIRFEEGTGTQLEIKNANIELEKARTNKIKAIHDFIIAEAELDNLLGKLSYSENGINKN